MKQNRSLVNGVDQILPKEGVSWQIDSLIHVMGHKTYFVNGVEVLFQEANPLW